MQAMRVTTRKAIRRRTGSRRWGALFAYTPVLQTHSYCDKPRRAQVMGVITRKDIAEANAKLALGRKANLGLTTPSARLVRRGSLPFIPYGAYDPTVGYSSSRCVLLAPTGACLLPCGPWHAIMHTDPERLCSHTLRLLAMRIPFADVSSAPSLLLVKSVWLIILDS